MILLIVAAIILGSWGGVYAFVAHRFDDQPRSARIAQRACAAGCAVAATVCITLYLH